jgi:hypothetical protein
VSASRAGHEIKLLDVHPYMTTVVHKPYRIHRTARVNFVNGYLHGVKIGETEATFVLLSDEAWIHLSGYVNSQNTRHWTAGNPRVINKRSFIA